MSIQGLETYFWPAPDAYVGNKLVSYGQNIRIKTSWHTGRGDTAGISTKGPDIVIEVRKIFIKLLILLKTKYIMVAMGKPCKPLKHNLL